MLASRRPTGLLYTGGILVLGLALVVSTGSVRAQSTAAPDVVVTEVLYDGQSLLGLGELEWMEVYNPGPLPVNLQGWTLEDPSPAIGELGSYTIQAEVDLPPGAYALLCQSTPDGVPCDVNYDGIGLSGDRDEIRLLRPDGTEADRIAYGEAGWPVPNVGEPIVYTGTSGATNDQGNAWARATRRLGYTTTGDNAGSPRLRGPQQRTPVVAPLADVDGWRFFAPPTEGRTVGDIAAQIRVQGVEAWKGPPRMPRQTSISRTTTPGRPPTTDTGPPHKARPIRFRSAGDTSRTSSTVRCRCATP